MPEESVQDRLKNLPSVDKVLDQSELDSWKGSAAATEMVRAVIAEIRENILKNHAKVPSETDVARIVNERIGNKFAPRLKRVVNATGIIIHTNIGRSPLSEEAINAITGAVKGYSSLEYDLDKGRRGSRHNLVKHLLLSLTGAEDALVANNNAAAVLLALTALSKRKEVVVSRGQLVEIGGSFRIPDICKAGGAKLREVGTTNRTRITDYEKAISSKTGLLLQVHSSNYKIIGFTEETGLEDLVRIGEKHDLPVVYDLGSGALFNPGTVTPLRGEPVVSEIVKSGVSVVTFSGDKLLGGPQAGLAVGKKKYIDKMRKHPLMRAVRPDKMTFAALDATLRMYLVPGKIKNLPLWKMLSGTTKELEEYAMKLNTSLKNEIDEAGFKSTVEKSDSYAGGGSLPTELLESRALVLTGTGKLIETIQKRLRNAEIPLISYIKDGGLHFDIRTLYLENMDEVAGLIRNALVPAKGE